MFAVSVEAAVQEADPLVQDVLVLGHHSVSHHPLLPDEPLELVSAEASEPHRSSDHVFWMSFKISCSQTQSNPVMLINGHYSLVLTGDLEDDMNIVMIVMKCVSIMFPKDSPGRSFLCSIRVMISVLRALKG